MFGMAKYPTYVGKKCHMSELVPALPIGEVAGNSNIFAILLHKNDPKILAALISIRDTAGTLNLWYV